MKQSPERDAKPGPQNSGQNDADDLLSFSLAVLAANHSGPGSRAQPAVALLNLAELLAEVCVARLAVANNNQALVTDTLEGTL